MAPFLFYSPYMNGRLLDSNNDIFLDANGHVARASTLKERVMRLFADEIGEEIKDKVREIEGVASVDDMMVEIDGRNISGRYKVTLDNGETVKGNF